MPHAFPIQKLRQAEVRQIEVKLSRLLLIKLLDNIALSVGAKQAC